MRRLGLLATALRRLVRDPRRSARYVSRLPDALRASDVAGRLAPSPSAPPPARPANPLRAYVDAHTTGQGIWKWDHYLDIYHRHFQRFVGTDVHIVEIGVYSGGSLQMWRDYFGPKCRVVGIDIEPACRAYADDRIEIFIGDQADRGFWRTFRGAVPRVDILVDDGGHYPEQQMVTLEEMLPHLRPGGVYLCEDVHGIGNRFAAYAHGLADQLNPANPADREPGDTRLLSTPTPLQAAIRSIHLYPFVVVIEKADGAPERLVARRQGTEWQPFRDTR